MNIDLLKSFCSKDGVREDINNPFQQGEYVYATDGFIAIRVDKEKIDNLDGVPINNEIKISELFTKNEPSVVPLNYTCQDVFSALIEIPMVQKQKTVDCPECDGEGEIECLKCGYTHECKKCDGDGVIGTNEYYTERDNRFCIKIGNRYFTSENIQKVFDYLAVSGETEVSHYELGFGEGGICLLPLISAQILLMPTRYSHVISVIALKASTEAK